MDGLEMWRALHESGVVGVIRGEVAMGWYVVEGAAARAVVPSYPAWPTTRAGSLVGRLDLPGQDWPAPTSANDLGETAQQHADRLYYEESACRGFWRRSTS